MGILKLFFDKLNNMKYNQLKNKYIKDFNESGFLGSIDDLQEYIKEKK